MAFKMVVLFASLAYASAGYVEADPHHTYSSAPAVSYSSITHHAPSVAVAKTVSYAEPAVHYTAPIAKSYAVHEPSLLKTVVAQPTYTKTLVQQPTYTKTLVSEPTYAHSAPVYAAKTVAYQAPIAYSAPVVKNVEYAPVAKTFVSHPAYTKAIVAEPAYAKSYVSEPAYTKAYVSEPTYAKTYVSEPTYAKAYVSEPAYAKSYVSEPTYTKTLVQQPVYAKTLVQQPVYSKTLVQQPAIYAQSAPVVATKTLSYSPAAQVAHVSYEDNSAHYAW
ncbi:adhesive plaque matrix protein-like [Topomyia yanbarensis]|uniref:adhesive plaque matrix protein-like n=1 Tax=Topomyia yanbarensis TaxID=2498891 RepID=UPI00273CEB31|nr:adhesive plaque matrix protein-like [Topomyia yanbarensis]